MSAVVLTHHVMVSHTQVLNLLAVIDGKPKCPREYVEHLGENTRAQEGCCATVDTEGQ